MKAWALSRIGYCRREESKFGSAPVAIDAAQERRTLTAVLEQLGFDVPLPDGHEEVQGPRKCKDR